MKQYKKRQPITIKETEYKFLKTAGSRKAAVFLEAIIRNHIDTLTHPLPIPKSHFFKDKSAVIMLGKDAWDIVTKKANEFNVSKVELLHHLINTYKGV